MRSFRAVVPLGLWLAGARASSDLTGFSPAQATLASMKGLVVGAPEPTPAPRVKKAVKRAQGANTCGYVNGDPSRDVTCEAEDSVCLYESDAFAVGCCELEDCEIWTACLDRTDSDIWSTADFSRTRYCSETASPSCAVYAYQDDVWDGYTMILCAEESTALDFYYTADGTDEDDVTSLAEADDVTITRSSSDSEETVDRGEDSDSAEGDVEAGGGGGSGRKKGGGTPVGAIAGGTVGGVAALALVGAGAFLLIRRRKKDAATPAEQTPMVGSQYPNQPPPGSGGPNQMYSAPPSMYIPPPNQGHPPGMAPMSGPYYAPQEPGMAKAPLSPMSTTPSQMTPSDSLNYNPSTYNPSNYNPSVSGAPPPSASPAAHAQHTPPPGPYGGYAQPAQQGHSPQQQAAVELPTGRPDGELRELA